MAQWRRDKVNKRIRREEEEGDEGWWNRLRGETAVNVKKNVRIN